MLVLLLHLSFTTLMSLCQLKDTEEKKKKGSKLQRFFLLLHYFPDICGELLFEKLT